MEIQDFNDYLIYEDGRVFSKRRNKFRKPGKDTHGYNRVLLWKNNKHKSFLIHRLVGLYYLDKIEGKDYIDHIDGDKSNNHVNNLRWTTKIENENNYQKLSKNNTLGLKNIIPYKNGFIFKKTIYVKRYQKNNKNLNEI